MHTRYMDTHKKNNISCHKSHIIVKREKKANCKSVKILKCGSLYFKSKSYQKGAKLPTHKHDWVVGWISVGSYQEWVKGGLVFNPESQIRHRSTRAIGEHHPCDLPVWSSHPIVFSEGIFSCRLVLPVFRIRLNNPSSEVYFQGEELMVFVYFFHAKL